MTAARAVLAGTAGATAATSATADVSRDRLLLGSGLLCIVLSAVVLRLVPTVFVPSINWGDEIFQTVEPAHRLVYGYGLVPWEFQLGMRSWLMPGAIAGLIEIARIFGDGPQYYLPAVAVGLGLLASAPVVCVFLWCRRQFGLAGSFVAAVAVAVAPELVYFGARTLNEVVAAHLLVIACYLTAPGYPVSSRRDFAAGVLFGVVSLLRLQLAPAAAVIALWPGPGAWRSRLVPVIAGGAMVLAFGAAFDWLTLGAPLASVWRNLYYNLYLGISSGFSVEPWSYYLLGELGVWAAAAPFVVLLVALGARRMPVLLAACITLVAMHSAIPHKEYRFIYPAVLLAMVLAAFGLAQLTGWAEEWLRRRGVRQSLATALAAIVLSGSWSGVAFATWSNGTIGKLRQRAHDELVAMLFVHDMPAPCGVGLYGRNAWVRYGGYTYLHRPVPMFWPENGAELTAGVSAFDTLLYDGYERAPQPKLGFEPIRCFGRICVAHRAGGCEARPPPAMWFPERLRGMIPAGRRFEAIPPSARLAGAAQAER